METYNTNGKLYALDGSHYRIAYPYCNRERPLWFGTVNFDPICSECGKFIPQSRPKAMTCSEGCSDLRGQRRKVGVAE